MIIEFYIYLVLMAISIRGVLVGIALDWRATFGVRSRRRQFILIGAGLASVFGSGLLARETWVWAPEPRLQMP